MKKEASEGFEVFERSDTLKYAIFPPIYSFSIVNETPFRGKACFRSVYMYVAFMFFHDSVKANELGVK